MKWFSMSVVLLLLVMGSGWLYCWGFCCCCFPRLGGRSDDGTGEGFAAETVARVRKSPAPPDPPRCRRLRRAGGLHDFFGLVVVIVGIDIISGSLFFFSSSLGFPSFGNGVIFIGVGGASSSAGTALAVGAALGVVGRLAGVLSRDASARGDQIPDRPAGVRGTLRGDQVPVYESK